MIRAIVETFAPPANPGPVRHSGPVRRAGEVVHATTTAVSADDVLVRSALSPQPGLSIGMKLYFLPPAESSSGARGDRGVGGVSSGAEFRDSNSSTASACRSCLGREMGTGPFPLHTNLRRPSARGAVRSPKDCHHISRSGAF